MIYKKKLKMNTGAEINLYKKISNKRKGNEMKQYNFDEKLKLYYIDYISELGTERIYASKEENMKETINFYESMLQDIRNGKKLKKTYEVLI